MRGLPLAAGDFVLAHAALKACPSRLAGQALLKKLAVLAPRFPGDDLARLTLSRAQIDWGNPQDALPALTAVLQGDGANFEARYLLGMANLRLAERQEGEARSALVQAAQRHLQRAHALIPPSSEAAFAVFKAEAAATQGPGKAALEGVIAAWQKAREVDALGRSAARALAFARRVDEAHQTLVSLAQNERDEPASQWARQWQGRLETGVSRGDILAEMRRNPATDASFKEWTIDKERVLQTVERGHGRESADNALKAMARQNDAATGNNGADSAGKRQPGRAGSAFGGRQGPTAAQRPAPVRATQSRFRRSALASRGRHREHAGTATTAPCA